MSREVQFPLIALPAAMVIGVGSPEMRATGGMYRWTSLPLAETASIPNISALCQGNVDASM